MTAPSDRETFEAAMEIAARYMANPNRAPGDMGFDEALAVIGAYASTLPDITPDQAALAPNDPDLGQRLEALRRRSLDLQRHYDADHPPIGDGYGPTLGGGLPNH
jgi:hypothetical protein